MGTGLSIIWRPAFLVEDGSPEAQNQLAARLRRSLDQNDNLLLVELLAGEVHGLKKAPTRELLDAVTDLLKADADPIIRVSAIALLAKYPKELAVRIEPVLSAGSRGDPSVAVAALRALAVSNGGSVVSMRPLRAVIDRADLRTAPGLSDAACAGLDSLGKAWLTDRQPGVTQFFREVVDLAGKNLGTGGCSAASKTAEQLDRLKFSQWIIDNRPESAKGWGLVLVAFALTVYAVVQLGRIALLFTHPGRFMRTLRPLRPLQLFITEKQYAWLSVFTTLTSG